MAINIFTASGNIGKDAEQRWTQNGKCVASFSLPVKQGYGEHEKTSWVKCTLLGAKAEKLPQYLTKGTKVIVSGEFVLEEWQGQDGQQNKMPVLIVNSLDFGGSAQGKQQQQQSYGQAPQQPAYQQAPQQPQMAPQQQVAQQQQRQPPQNQQQAQYSEPPMDFDSDIPF